MPLFPKSVIRYLESVICSLLKVDIETKHQIVGVEVKTPVLGRAVVFCRMVATLIAEESDMGHEAEFVTEVKRYAGTESDAVFHSRAAVGAAYAEVDTAVDKEVYTL